jgi:hypothetical protein
LGLLLLDIIIIIIIIIVVSRGVRFPAGGKKEVIPLRRTGSGAHRNYYPMRSGGVFPRRVKTSGREADHSPPSSVEVKNPWSYTSTPPHVLIAWYLVKHRSNFTFLFLLLLFIITAIIIVVVAFVMKCLVG